MPPLVDMLTLDTEECPCTVDNCPVVIARRRLARMTPRQAVAVAAGEGPNSPLLFQVAMATLDDHRYRRSGATKMYVQHILQEQKIEGKAHWEIPMMGLINVYAAVHQSRTEIEDAAILREFHSSFHQILEIIFKDFHFLTPAGKVGDSRRTLVSKFLLFSRDDPETRRYVTQNSAGRNCPISPFSQVDV